MLDEKLVDEIRSLKNRIIALENKPDKEIFGPSDPFDVFDEPTIDLNLGGVDILDEDDIISEIVEILDEGDIMSNFVDVPDEKHNIRALGTGFTTFSFLMSAGIIEDEDSIGEGTPYCDIFSNQLYSTHVTDLILYAGFEINHFEFQASGGPWSQMGAFSSIGLLLNKDVRFRVKENILNEFKKK